MSTDIASPQLHPAKLRLCILAIVALYFLLRLWHLSIYVINDKFDEGVYLSLMQGVAAGKGQLYKDYILCHPPGVIWMGAWLWPKVQGNLTYLRLIYIAFCALSLVPLTLIARKLFGEKTALLALFFYALSPGFANWLGREIFLDPILNVPLLYVIGVMVIVKKQSSWMSFVLGAVLGLSYLIKETALPTALAICLGLFIVSRDYYTNQLRNEEVGSFSRWSWLWFGMGTLAGFLAVIIPLSHIPNYNHYTFGLNAQDTRNWGKHFYELQTGFLALPFPLTFGILGIAVWVRRIRPANERFLGIFAISTMAMMFLIPKMFYWRYLLPTLPICSVGAADWLIQFFTKVRRRKARRAAGTVVVICVIVHLFSVILYHTHESVTPPEYDTALTLLKLQQGSPLTLNPLWAAASGHPLSPKVQQLIKTTIHSPVTVREYETVLNECQIALLDKEAIRWLPVNIQEEIRVRFHSIFHFKSPGDSRYLEILIKP